MNLYNFLLAKMSLPRLKIKIGILILYDGMGVFSK